jgi:N-acetylglucosamine malate deacetylase 2
VTSAARSDDRTLSGRSILAVFAHPDDESLACGGTLARLSDAGVRVVLLCATRGERGTGTDHAPEHGEAPGRTRTNELHAAARLLGISDVLIFDHPDGNLRWADEPELTREIAAAMDACRPDAVITFDSDGLYWHADHVGVHERTRAAAQTLGAAAPPLYYVTMRPGTMREIAEAAARDGWTAPTEGVWSIAPDAFGVPLEPPSFTVDVEAWVPRKIQALACHRSQFRDDNPFARLSPADARRLLGTEYFRRSPKNVRTSAFERVGEPLVSRDA